MKAASSPTAATDQVPAGARSEWRERSARLYSEFEAAARAMVRRAFRGAFGEDELDDIYSNAWLGTLRALEHRHSQLSDDEVRSYVFAAVAHQASREIRRRKRKPTAPLEAALTHADAAPTPDERAASTENSRVTRDLLASLPPRRRSVMLLRYGWGLDPQQVCSLVKGLSPRAYRKEVTRGVDELAEKVRAFESGDWCTDREPVLKAFAAGIADPEQARQAHAHLSHCRECNDFVARLSGHLHDLGGAVLAPAAVEGLGGSAPLTDRLGELGDRAREGVANVLTRAPAGSPEDAVASVASSGGARGAGLAGAGLAAKLAGIGTAGKVAVACVSGGVAASACIAAGVAPLDTAFEQADGGSKDPQPATVAEESAEQSPLPTPETLPSQVEAEPAPPPPTAPPATVPAGDQTTTQSGGQDGADAETEETPHASAPIEPTAPVQAQEFQVEAAAVPASPAPAPATTSDGSGTTSSGGGGAAPSRTSAVQQEFGP